MGFNNGVRSGTLAIAISLAVLVVVGCGAPSKEELADERASYVDVLQEAVSQRDLATAKRGAARTEAKCRKRIGGFVSALRDLDSRLVVGVTLSSYSDEMARIRVQYDRIVGAAGVGNPCYEPAANAQDAMNVHVSAYNNWRDCVTGEGDWALAVDEYGYSNCEFDWIEESMQSSWRTASELTAKARRRLDAIGTRFERPVRLGEDVPINKYMIAGSVYGRVVEVLCRKDVPLDATKPCQNLEDLLDEGIEDDELDDLNRALEGLTGAYDMQPRPGQSAASTSS